MKYVLSSLGAIFLMIIMIANTGCSSMAKVAVTKPAEIDILGINKIVIGEVGGNRGYQMQDAITSKLFASEKYDVIDRTTFDRIARQQNFNLSRDMDTAQLQQIGNILGTAVMVTGTSSSNFNYKRGMKRYTDRNGVKHRKNTVDAKLKLSTRFHLVELSSGRVLGQKNIVLETSRSTSAIDRWAIVPNPDDMAPELIDKTTTVFMRTIAPFVTYVDVTFEEAITKDGKRAIELAQVGQWHDALPAFLSESNIQNTAASWHNTGLCYLYTFQFEEAKKSFRKCLSLEPLTGCIKGLNKATQMNHNESHLLK